MASVYWSSRAFFRNRNFLQCSIYLRYCSVY